MIVLAVVILGAVAAGLLRGGSLDSLARTRARWVWLIFAGFAFQIGVELLDPPWLSESSSLAVVLASNALIAIFLLVNRVLPGTVLAALGLGLNIAVIGANGAMPVSAAAAGRSTAEIEQRSGIKHEVMDSDTVFPWLGDVLPVAATREILSAGDVLLAAGIARLIYKQTRAGREGPSGTGG